MVGVVESLMKGTKPRGGTGSIQRQYEAVLLSDNKTEAWPSVKPGVGGLAGLP